MQGTDAKTNVTAHGGQLAIPSPTDPSLVRSIINRLMIDLTRLGSVGGGIARCGNSLLAVSSTSGAAPLYTRVGGVS